MATFSIAQSKGLSDPEKTLLFQNLSKRLNPFKELSITSQQTRSQLRNRQDATQKLLAILEQGLFVPKERKKTKIPRSVKAKIKRQKGLKSDLKASRKKNTSTFAGLKNETNEKNDTPYSTPFHDTYLFSIM